MELKPSEALAKSIASVRDVFESVNLGPSPFENNSATFSCETFQVEAYSWTRDDQEWNFKWRDVEVSWYKYHPRSMTVNRTVSDAEAMQMLQECTAAICSAT